MSSITTFLGSSYDWQDFTQMVGVTLWHQYLHEYEGHNVHHPAPACAEDDPGVASDLYGLLRVGRQRSDRKAGQRRALNTGCEAILGTSQWTRHH